MEYSKYLLVKYALQIYNENDDAISSKLNCESPYGYLYESKRP